MVETYAYIRVSTKEQDEYSQRHALLEFASKRGFEVAEVFVDKGESGAKPFKHRPGAQRLLEAVRVRPKPILVFSIDRVGRGMLDTLNALMELEKLGAPVISIREEFLDSLDRNIRGLVLASLSWAAEFERNRIRERQEAAWRAGKQKGRPKKVPDSVLLKYLNKYAPQGLSLLAIWKVMRGDGHDISYTRFLRRVRSLGVEVRRRVVVREGRPLSD